MGRQINFFLHPEDQPLFDIFFKDFGDLLILPYYHHSNKVSIISDTIVGDHRKEGIRVYLIRKKDFKSIKLKYIQKFDYWLVDDNSPILHFDRCILRDNKILKGRLYYQPRYADKKNWFDKPEDFVLWADKIIKNTRRKLIKHKHTIGAYTYTEYLGQNAIAWMKNNNAEIGAAGGELISGLL